MELKEILVKRKSIRKYKSKKITDNKVSLLLGAAMLAPSAGNIQNCRFIIVDDKNKKDDIAKACMNQTWMAEAPIHIIICSDNSDLKSFFGKYYKNYSLQNSSAAMENILLKATELKLGSCWVSAFSESNVKRILQIPDEIEVHGIITVGYPNEKPLRKLKSRLKNIVFFNKYGPY